MVRSGVSQQRDVGPRPPFIRISQAPSGTLIQISRHLWPSKPGCDAHICLNLGFASQNSRLSQVSLFVCYFWLSSFRMDEGNPLPSEHGLCRRPLVQIKPPQPFELTTGPHRYATLFLFRRDPTILPPRNAASCCRADRARHAPRVARRDAERSRAGGLRARVHRSAGEERPDGEATNWPMRRAKPSMAAISPPSGSRPFPRRSSSSMNRP
jgi:hypothetical protein